MRKLRLFFAIDLDDFLKEKLLKKASQFQNIRHFRWTKKENLHLTLLFLGYLNEDRLPKLVQVSEKVFKNFQPFILEFEDIRLAPSANSARMIWATLKNSPIIEHLRKELEKALITEGINFPEENRELKWHITLARFPSQKVKDQKLIFKEKLKVQEINLMESQLSPQGPNYFCLNRFPL